MSQFTAWEREYNKPKMITNSDEPAVAFKDFVKWLKRKEGVDLSSLSVLDLGAGTGKNAIYLAERGAKVFGIELSKEAVKISKERAKTAEVSADFREGSFGESMDFKDESFDLVLDVTSSNSLDEKEREVYLKETLRVLKPGGYMFVRALCKDGDKKGVSAELANGWLLTDSCESLLRNSKKIRPFEESNDKVSFLFDYGSDYSKRLYEFVGLRQCGVYGNDVDVVTMTQYERNFKGALTKTKTQKCSCVED